MSFDPSDYRDRSNDPDPFSQVDAGDDGASDGDTPSADDRAETIRDSGDDGADDGGGNGGSSTSTATTTPDNNTSQDRADVIEQATNDSSSTTEPDSRTTPETNTSSNAQTPTAEERADVIRETAQSSSSSQTDPEPSPSQSEPTESTDTDTRQPSAQERAETIGGDTVQRAADKLDQQTAVDVNAQDVRLNRADDGKTATASVGGAAAEAIRNRQTPERNAQQLNQPQQPATQGNRAALPGETSPLSETQAEAVNQVDQQFPNADITRQDVDLNSERSNGKTTVSAQLSDEGRSTVAKGRSPFDDTPVLGPAFDAGAEAGVEYREFVQENEERYNKATPDTKELLGAAAVGVAAPEPVSTGTGVVVGGTLLGAAAVGSQLKTEQISGSAQSEIEVPEQGQRPEIAVPEQPGSTQSELDATEQQTTEVRVPDSAPTRSQGEIDTPETAPGSTNNEELTVTSSQLIQREEEQTPEISEDDIVTGIGEPDQPGPSTRERQRRDDLFAPERTFPTGESSVIGRSVEEEQVTEPSVSQEDSVREGTGVGLGSGSGAGSLLGATPGSIGDQETGLGSDTELEVGIRPDSLQRPFATPELTPTSEVFNQTTETVPTDEVTAFEEVTATEPATGLGSASGADGSSRLPRPSFDLPDDDENDDDDPLSGEDLRFETGIASGADVLGESTNSEDSDVFGDSSESLLGGSSQ